MKGRSLISIFLFLSLIIIVPVSADEGVFSWSGTDDGYYDIAASAVDGGNAWTITQIYIDDAGALRYLDYVMVRCPITGNTIIPSANSYWVPVEYKIGAVVVGTGTYGYLKNADDTVTIAAFMNDDYDTGDFSGIQTVSIVGSIPAIRWNVAGTGNTYIKWAPGQDMAYLAYNGNRVVDSGSGNMLFTSKAAYTSTNTYEYEKTDNYLYLNLNRTGSNELQVIVDNGYEELINETSLQDDDLVIYDTDMDNGTWSIYAINYFGDYDTHIINFGVLSTAYIEFNQSHYTDPENIVVSGEITNMDNDNYIYLVEMISTIDGDVSSSFFEASGNWNVSPYITFCCGSVLFDFYSDSYDLPVWIQSNLWTKNKNTGAWTKLANTPAVLYHEAALDSGQIWTDKSNYNVTELVEISYTTNVAENFIYVEEPHSSWVEYDVPVGTYSFFYELSTSAVGNTTIYLSENSVVVDQVTISVSSESGDDAYAAWMKDYYFEGETASFYYYSSNASAQITVYDGADIIVFGPATTQLGYHNGRVNTANTNPGTFLLSLYHNGTYYNDTMIFESVDSWVRFDSSKYYVGDTINIEYYLADPRHAISMWDAHKKLVIRFTTEHGRVVSGSMETVPFTLSENNEYSYDILGRLDSGYHTLGYWQIFIEDEYGALDTWDEAYVCNAIDDDGSYGTDTSNEMISIFFSPEGAFMLYTVCLTMMGLVLAKHPAGGGAGATVGVGFGAYFNVLPPWMLMLTVILLVVLGGVSVAAYYRGK